MTQTDVWDAFRLLAAITAAGTVAVALVVVYAYGTAYAITRKRTDLPEWRGLLPRHVTLVGLSYIGLIVASMIDMLAFLHDPPTWRPPTYLILYAAGLWAMWDVLGHSRHRLARLRNPGP